MGFSEGIGIQISPHNALLFSNSRFVGNTEVSGRYVWIARPGGVGVAVEPEVIVASAKAKSDARERALNRAPALRARLHDETVIGLAEPALLREASHFRDSV